MDVEVANIPVADRSGDIFKKAQAYITRDTQTGDPVLTEYGKGLTFDALTKLGLEGQALDDAIAEMQRNGTYDAPKIPGNRPGLTEKAHVVSLALTEVDRTLALSGDTIANGVSDDVIREVINPDDAITPDVIKPLLRVPGVSQALRALEPMALRRFAADTMKAGALSAQGGQLGRRLLVAESQRRVDRPTPVPAAV